MGGRQRGSRGRGGAGRALKTTAAWLVCCFPFAPLRPFLLSSQSETLKGAFQTGSPPLVGTQAAHLPPSHLPHLPLHSLRPRSAGLLALSLFLSPGICACSFLCLECSPPQVFGSSLLLPLQASAPEQHHQRWTPADAAPPHQLLCGPEGAYYFICLLFSCSSSVSAT